MEQSNHWFLMKSDDGSVFGPISTSQLEEWANSAQISPQDKISTDEKNWLKAPQVSFLKMDFLLETGPDQFYGPTTTGTIKEFLEVGEVTKETPVINCQDGSIKMVGEMDNFPLSDAGGEAEQPIKTSLRSSLQQRIRELEETLMVERRAREHSEKLLTKLEAKLKEVAVLVGA
jgi:hypothetical protein